MTKNTARRGRGGKQGETRAVGRRPYRLATFMTPELAAEGAEIIEPLADWDVALLAATTQDEAQEIASEIIGDRWKDFVSFEWSFNCGYTLTKVWRGEGVASAA